MQTEKPTTQPELSAGDPSVAPEASAEAPLAATDAAGDPETPQEAEEGAGTAQEPETAFATVVDLPSPGRIVLYQETGQIGPVPAIVTRHWGRGLVNVCGFPAEPEAVPAFSASSVPCVGDKVEHLAKHLELGNSFGWIYPPRVEGQIEIPLPS